MQLYPNTPEIDFARFFARVEMTPTCWLWRGGVQATGYGVLSAQGRRWSAHRYMWTMVYGEIESLDIFVCHACDERLCVNPFHLFLGTNADNMRDMWEKGRRGRFGRWDTKPDYVEPVREARLSGRKLAAVAEEFGVSMGTVSHIANGVTWKKS